MNLERTLAREQTKNRCCQIVDWIGNDQDRFDLLMQYVLHGEPGIRRFASWPMSYCVQSHPELIKPWLRPLLALLEEHDVHPGLVRNTLRMLQFIDIPMRFRGQIMSRCFEYIQDPAAPVGIKAFSLTILENMAAKYPEIKPELKMIIEARWATEKPAFKVRGRKILNKLKY